MHRRHFLTSIAVLFALVLVAACGSIPVPETPAVQTPGESVESPTVPAATATPAPFKSELVLCMWAEPDMLVGSTMSLSDVIREAVLPSAVSYGDDYTAEPNLLASLPNPEDGTLVRHTDGTLTITLQYREGLVWSDGTAFDAADAILGMSLPIRPFDPAFEILDVQRVDALTVEVQVADGAEYPYVPPQPPLPTHILGDSLPDDLTAVDYFIRPVPSLGPYTVAEWVPGSHLLLNASPQSAPAPLIPVVRFRFIPDPAQILAEVQSGGCDVMVDGAGGFDTSAAGSSVRLYQTPGIVYEQLIFNALPDPFGGQTPYFADPRVRQAFAHAVDRGALTQQATQGVSPVMDSWLPADHWAYSSGLPQFGVDIARANALLDEAGWLDQDGDGIREYHGTGGTYACQRGEWAIEEGTPLSPTLITTNSPERQQIADAMRAALQPIGVDLQVQPLSGEVMFAPEGPVVRRTFDLALFGAVTRPDPGGISRFVGADVFRHPTDLTLVHRWQLEERWLSTEQLVERLALSNIPSVTNNWQGQNFAGWCSEEADLAIVAANETVNQAERQLYYQQQQAAVASEVPVLPLFARPRVAASAIYVCGIQLGPYDELTWNLAAWTFDETGACAQP